MTSYNEKLANDMKKITGNDPDIATFDFDTKAVVIGYKDELSALRVFAHYRKGFCNDFDISFSENLKLWIVRN